MYKYSIKNEHYFLMLSVLNLKFPISFSAVNDKIESLHFKRIKISCENSLKKPPAPLEILISI